MQRILAEVLSARFGLMVRVINGSTPGQGRSSATTSRARQTRDRILTDFRGSRGFNVLVLSPFVAGVGITITEANHVFHYGRWWNPAVEAQATDRVYRIGQEREVHVYLPILRDPSGRIEASFDERLDALLKRKGDLAEDFLAPRDSDETNAAELCQGLEADAPESSESSVLDMPDVDRLQPRDFEALAACLYEKRGYRVVLTARSSDGGADVIAVKNNQALLIQAKHSRNRVSPDLSALEDLLGASDTYEPYLPTRARLHLVTNGIAAPSLRQRASEAGIAISDRDQLAGYVRDGGVSLADVVSADLDRSPSFSDGVKRARALWST